MNTESYRIKFSSPDGLGHEICAPLDWIGVRLFSDTVNCSVYLWSKEARRSSLAEKFDWRVTNRHLFPTPIALRQFCLPSDTRRNIYDTSHPTFLNSISPESRDEFILRPNIVRGYCHKVTNGCNSLSCVFISFFTLHVSGSHKPIIRGISSCFLTLRLLMSYIYGAPILDVSRSHTTTQHSR